MQQRNLAPLREESMHERSGPKSSPAFWQRQARAILRAIKAGALDAVFQPIVEVASGQTIGMEALARPAGRCGFTTAQAFFDAAEHSGRATEADRLAHRRAFRAWHRRATEGLLFLNCAPSALVEPETVARLARWARRLGIPSHRVVLEVTERQGWADERDLGAAVQRGRAAGFQIALDDVGAGWSGLSRIISFRPDWIKLDRELVQGLPTDGMRRHLVRGLVQFGQEAGVRVIAEGVETPAQLQAAVDAGVTHVQGYLLARPNATPALPAPEVITSMRAWRIASAA